MPARIPSLKRLRPARNAVLASFALLISACADKSLLRFEKIAKSAERDDYAKAAADVRKNKDLYGGNSRLLYHMDLGVLFHYAGHYDSSIAELSKAVAVHEELFARSVTNEALSFVANDNSRPYRGKPHEIVLLHQFLAFNYLALGKYDAALVESRQTQLYLEELKRKAGDDVKAFADDGMFRYLTAIAYEAARQKDDAAISMYQAVKAYRRGPLALPPSVAANAYATLKARDREGDIQELKLSDPGAQGALAPGSRAQGPATAPGAVAESGALAGASGSGTHDPDGSEIIVIGHAGRSPALGQTVFWGTYARDGALVIHYRNPKGEVITQMLPAPGLPARELEKARSGRKTRSGTTFHVKFALPAIKEVNSATRFFSVAGEAAPVPVRSEALTDLDPILSRYLEETHTATLMRTVIRVVLRTITAQETKSAISGGNPLLNLFLNVGTDVLADQLEQADTRTWFLLPNTIQIARIPVKPGVHSITVEAHDGSGRSLGARTFDNLSVKAGEKKFVFHASLK